MYDVRTLGYVRENLFTLCKSLWRDVYVLVCFLHIAHGEAEGEKETAACVRGPVCFLDEFR